MTDSKIRLFLASDDYLTLPNAQALVSYAQSGERIRDRLGLVHRIAPDAHRYPVGLTLLVLPEELTRESESAAPVSALEWIEAVYRAGAQLVVYVNGETLAEGGAALTRNLAYRAYIEELPPECFGTLPGVGRIPDAVELALLVVEDGTFADFDSLAGYEQYVPARSS